MTLLCVFYAIMFLNPNRDISRNYSVLLTTQNLFIFRVSYFNFRLRITEPKKYQYKLTQLLKRTAAANNSITEIHLYQRPMFLPYTKKIRKQVSFRRDTKLESCQIILIRESHSATFHEHSCRDL